MSVMKLPLIPAGRKFDLPGIERGMKIEYSLRHFWCAVRLPDEYHLQLVRKLCHRYHSVYDSDKAAAIPYQLQDPEELRPYAAAYAKAGKAEKELLQ